MATLDLLSDGRLELGIGAGWMTADYEKAGMPLDRPGVRIARLAESITILKGLFAAGPFTFHGEHYQVTELDGMPKPVQRPRPAVPHRRRRHEDPRARRARGADRRDQREPAHRATASRARPRSRSLPAATDQKLAWLREAAGARFDDLEIQTLLGFVHVTDDASGIVEGDGRLVRRVRRRRAARAGDARRHRSTSIVELLEHRRERWQMSYIVVPIESTETLAPVVARLAGN